MNKKNEKTRAIIEIIRIIFIGIGTVIGLTSLNKVIEYIPISTSILERMQIGFGIMIICLLTMTGTVELIYANKEGEKKEK